MLTLTAKTPLWIITAALPLCLSVITQTAGRNDTYCSAGKLPTVFGIPDQRVNGLVLNLEERASCNGTVTAWKVCYYVNGEERTEINVGIWRENTENEMFQNIQNCTLPVPSLSSESGFEFVCQHWELPLEQCFNLTVQVDDVIGVHLTKNMTLNILGQVAGSTLLLRENMNSNGGNFTDLTDSGMYIEARIETDEAVNTNESLDLTMSTTQREETNETVDTSDLIESPTTPDQTESIPQRADKPLWAIYAVSILSAVIVILVVLVLLFTLYGYRRYNRSKIESLSTTSDTVGFQLSSFDAENSRVNLTAGHNGTGRSLQLHDVQTAMYNVSMTATPPSVNPHVIETNANVHQGTISKGRTPQASPLSMPAIHRFHHPPHSLPAKISVSADHSHLEDTVSPSNRAKALTPLSPGNSRIVHAGHHQFLRRSSFDGVLLSSQPEALHVVTKKESFEFSEAQSDEHSYASINSRLSPLYYRNLRRSVSESHLVDLPFENLPHDVLSDLDEDSYAIPRAPHPYLQYMPVYSYAYAPIKLTFPRTNIDKQARPNPSLPSPNENSLVDSQQSANTYESVEPSKMASTGWFTSPHFPSEESSEIGTRRKKAKSFLDRTPVQNQEHQPAFHYDYAIAGSRIRFYSLPGMFPGKRFHPAIKPTLSLERLRKEALQQRKPMVSERSVQSGITSGNGYTDLRYSRMDPGSQTTYQSTSYSQSTESDPSSPRLESDYDYYVNDDQYPCGTSPYSRRYMRLQETRQSSIGSYQFPVHGRSLRRSAANQSHMYKNVGLHGLTEEVTERLHIPHNSPSDNTSKADSDVEFDDCDSLIGISKSKI